MLPFLAGAALYFRYRRTEAALRPGVRQNELSAIFLRGVFEQGATSSIIDPIWSITPLSVASDIYAFGIVWFEMLTGQLPFSSRAPFERLHKPPARPSRLRSDVPGDAERILLGCLERRPEQRYGTADAVLDALRSVESTITLPTTPSSRRRIGTIALAVASVAAEEVEADRAVDVRVARSLGEDVHGVPVKRRQRVQPACRAARAGEAERVDALGERRLVVIWEPVARAPAGGECDPGEQEQHDRRQPLGGLHQLPAPWLLASPLSPASAGLPPPAGGAAFA